MKLKITSSVLPSFIKGLAIICVSAFSISAIANHHEESKDKMAHSHAAKMADESATEVMEPVADEEVADEEVASEEVSDEEVSSEEASDTKAAEQVAPTEEEVKAELEAAKHKSGTEKMMDHSHGEDHMEAATEE